MTQRRGPQAAAVGRWNEYQFERMFYVVAAQQELHFQQLFKMLELMGHDWSKRCEHISFGMVLGMSTRKGNVVFLEDILMEAKQVMHEVMKKNESKYEQIEDPEAVADIIGMSAVIVQDMSARRIKVWPRQLIALLTTRSLAGPLSIRPWAKRPDPGRRNQHARMCVRARAGLHVRAGAHDQL